MHTGLFEPAKGSRRVQRVLYSLLLVNSAICGLAWATNFVPRSDPLHLAALLSAFVCLAVATWIIARTEWIMGKGRLLEYIADPPSICLSTVRHSGEVVERARARIDDCVAVVCPIEIAPLQSTPHLAWHGHAAILRVGSTEIALSIQGNQADIESAWRAMPEWVRSVPRTDGPERQALGDVKLVS